jgi:hypothetical protein
VVCSKKKGRGEEGEAAPGPGSNETRATSIGSGGDFSQVRVHAPIRAMGSREQITLEAPESTFARGTDQLSAQSPHDIDWQARTSDGEPSREPPTRPPSPMGSEQSREALWLSARLPTANGQPLDPDTRAYFEAHLGVPLGDVRVHAGAAADAAARALDARAFAFSGSVAFRAGQYQPRSRRGRALLAHELTHVAQFIRAGGQLAESGELSVSDESHRLEAEAREVAESVRLGDSWQHVPNVAPRGMIFLDGTSSSSADEVTPAEEEHLLAEGEAFKWVGALNAPILVLRKSWLLKVVGVPRNASEIRGTAHPKLMRAVLSALIDRYPWAAANREDALRDVSALSMTLTPVEWKKDEIQVPVAQSVFARIGLPPEASVQIYPDERGVTIYIDLRNLFPKGATADEMQSLKPAIAERVAQQVESHAARSMTAGNRRRFVEAVRSGLPSRRFTFIVPLSEGVLKMLLGEAAWNDVLTQRSDLEGGRGAVLAVAGGGYVLPPDISVKDQQTVTTLLSQLVGSAAPGAPPPERPQPLTHEDVQALLGLAHRKDKDNVIAVIQRGRYAGGLTAPQTISALIELAKAQRDREVAAKQVGYTLPTPDPDQEPILSRPVHGRILNKSGQLVPAMKGKFEFETLDQVDAYRVPHVRIRWFAVKPGTPPGTSPIDAETTSYIETRDDGFLNDREFTVTFDKIGTYEIHAFVSHNFYLPNHFVIPVEVKTEHARQEEQERESGAGTFGKTTSAAKPYKFQDVKDQGQDIQTTVSIIAGLGLGPAGTFISFAVPEIGEEEATGLRSTGALSAEAFGTPGGSLAMSRRTIQQEIDSLDRLIKQYSGSSGQDDLKEWATGRRDRLIATRDRLAELSGKTENKPIAVQGSYVTRTPGQRSGPLHLAAWFTYETTSEGGGGTYHGHLFDHSELVRSEDFHFRASETGYERMMERLFFDLSRTYPNGTMSFSFQMYEVLTATRRFVRLERVTDTPLQDIRNVAFSEPVSLVVNIAAALLTVFPPTAPLGIAISLAYNGLNAGLNMADAMRTDTVHASNYIDIGLVALDVIPLLGKASKVLRIGETGYRVLSAGQHAGMAYMFTESTYLQVRQLRDGMVTDLAKQRDELATLQVTNPSDPSLAAKRLEVKELEEKIRTAAVDIFTEAAVHQGITMAAQHAITRAVAAHVEGKAGPRPEVENEARPRPAEEGRPGAREEGEPGIVRAQDEAVHGGAAKAPTDPVLSLALPADLQSSVPVHRGPPPEPGGVEVHYRTDALGLITEIEIRAGKGVLPKDIEQHVAVVRTMQRYRGIGGAIRVLFERLKALAKRRGAFVPGSALFEASLEVEKLPRIIAERAESLRTHLLDPEVRKDLEADLEHLKKELARHERTVAQGEEEAGVGFVARTVPKSNAAAIAAGRPRLEGKNAAPGHYYYQTPDGGFELRQYAHGNEKAKQLALVKEGGKDVWRVIDRPDGPRSFASFLEIQRTNFGEPLAGSPNLEKILGARFGGNKTDQSGIAVARRWGTALEALHDGAGNNGPALVDRLLDKLRATTTDTSYGDFRREVRTAMVEQALAGKTSDVRVARMRTLLDTLPDARSQGEVFTAFRTKLAAESGSPISYMQAIPNAETRLPNGRVADGAVNITAAQTKGPKVGRYLAEDKSGSSFDPGQAIAYSKQLKTGGNMITTGDGKNIKGNTYKGVIYSFSSKDTALTAMATLDPLHPNIHVGYFDTLGQFKWLR